MKVDLKHSLIVKLKLLAIRSPYLHKVSSIILDSKGKIISSGFNRTKTHPMQSMYAVKVGMPAKIHCHAEIDALRKLPLGANPTTIIVARYRKNGIFAMAKPCEICELAIKDYGIKTIIYTDINGEFIDEG